MERMDRLNAFQNLLEQKEYLTLRAAMTRENEVDIAEFIEGLSKENAVIAFRTLPKELAAEVFSNLSPDMQQVMVDSFTDTELSEMVEELFVDDVVDMLEEMPSNVVKRVLRSADRKHVSRSIPF